MKYIKEASTKLHEKKMQVVTAESCTGGWVAKIITDLPGSSIIFDRGFVTYSNKAKQEMLDVSKSTLEEYGAVSEQVVAGMAEGALKKSDADISLSISGVAGPGGGTTEKPVGMVCFGWAKHQEKTKTDTVYFDGDRDLIRQQAVEYALKGLIKMIE